MQGSAGRENDGAEGNGRMMVMKQEVGKAKLEIVTAMLIFGSIGLFVRGIGMPSSVIAVVRGALGSLFLVAAGAFMKKKISLAAWKANWLVLVLSGAAIGANWIFLFESYRYTTVSCATLSYYCAPVFVILLSPLVLKEKLTLKRILCAAGAIFGMALVADVFHIGEGGSNNLLGIGLGLIAAALYACVVLLNKFLKGLTGIESTSAQLAVAALVLLPYTLLTYSPGTVIYSTRAVLLLLVVGVVHTGFAYCLYFSSLQTLSGQTSAVMSYIDPVTAIFLSAFLLGETMTPLQAAGGVLVLGMTLISELRK